MINKSVRCTVCTWRGDTSDALAAPRSRRSDLPPAMEQVQAAYEEAQSLNSAMLGMPKLPPCPECGHHLTPVQKRASVHPSAL